MLKVQRLEDILLDSMVDQMLESQIACFRRSGRSTRLYM